MFKIVTVDEPEPGHLCLHCGGICRDPSRLEQCKHRYCRRCTDSIKGTDGSYMCVACHVVSEQCHRDREASLEIGRLPCLCPNRTDNGGCLWRGQLREIKEHTVQCPWENSTCDNPGCYISVMRKDVAEHAIVCDYQRVRCERCNATVLLCDMSMHTEYDCERQRANDQSPSLVDDVGDCGYRALGCGIRYTESDFEHHQHAWTRHFGALGTFVEFVTIMNAILLPMVEKIHVDGVKERTEKSTESCIELDCTVTSLFDEINSLWSDMKFRVGRLQKVRLRWISIQSDLQRCHGALDFIQSSAVAPQQRNEGGQILSVPRADSLFSRLQRLLKEKEQLAEKVVEFKDQLHLVDCGSYDSVLVWKVDKFDTRYGEAISRTVPMVYGPPFRTSIRGYRMCVQLMLYGNENDDTSHGSHMAVYVGFLPSEFDELFVYPAVGSISITLHDLEGQDDFKKQTTFKLLPAPADADPFVPYYVVGFSRFVPHRLLHSGRFVKKDIMYLRFDVAVT